MKQGSGYLDRPQYLLITGRQESAPPRRTRMQVVGRGRPGIPWQEGNILRPSEFHLLSFIGHFSRDARLVTPGESQFTTRNQGGTIGLISGSGGIFDNLVHKPFMGRFPLCNFLAIDLVPNKISQLPTTTRNQTV